MLELKDLTKRFGSLTAVDHLNLKTQPGRIFGLIGPNGSGKTTTFRMILDLLTPNEGEILWNGKPIKSFDKNKLGFLPEERSLYPKMQVEEQLLFFAALKGLDKASAKPRIDEWLHRFSLEEKRHAKAMTLSKGNQQKLQLVISFIHRPQLLILDEPFSGLDPVNAEFLEHAILEQRENGTSVILSSHRMENIETLCDDLCLLKEGKSLFSGPLTALKKEFGRRVLTISKLFPLEEVRSWHGVNAVEEEEEAYLLHLEKEEDSRAIWERMNRLGYYDQFNMDYLSLEEIFKKKVREQNA